MTARISIHGFGRIGRIGRNVLRAALLRDVDFDVVAINGRTLATYAESEPAKLPERQLRAPGRDGGGPPG